MIREICLGIGLNMFFPKYVILVDAPPSVKEVFYNPRHTSKMGDKLKGYRTPHLTRMQNK